jgi:hypothetical protein
VSASAGHLDSLLCDVRAWRRVPDRALPYPRDAEHAPEEAAEPNAAGSIFSRVTSTEALAPLARTGLSVIVLACLIEPLASLRKRRTVLECLLHQPIEIG